MVTSKEAWNLLIRKGSHKESRDAILLSNPSPPVVTTQDIMAQRSNSFAYGSKKSDTYIPPTVYPALLSKVANELKRHITVSDHIKDDIEYKNTFYGREIVDKLSAILHTRDRKLALRVGMSLASQKLFHDVCYETRLVDSIAYLYEFSFNNQTIYQQQSDSLSEIESNRSFNEQPVVMENNTINGVFTELTYCYSPTCWDNRPCYSPTCPKRIMQLPLEIKDNIQLITESTYTKQQQQPPSPQQQQFDHGLWANTVDKELYDTIPKIERKRQENLYELIYTEEDYVESLNYVQTMWIKPLKERPIIPTARKEIFIQKVFRNIASIYEINTRLLHALKARQSENPIIYQVGDILLDFVIDFEPYIDYGSKQHEAKYTLENERFINANFEAFVQTTERHPSSLKLELNGYLTKPTTRLGRYTLLFNEILKHTPTGHPDKEQLPKAINIIKQFLSRVNYETGQAKNRFDLERIHYNLSFKYKTDEINLDLLAKSRSIIKQGTLKKTAQPDSVEYQVILFDHYLVIAKLKMNNGLERYVIQRRPIPLELLHIYLPRYDPSMHNRRSSSLVLPYLTNNNPNNTMMVASAGGSGMHVRASTDIAAYMNAQANTEMDEENNSCYPLTIQHLGRPSLHITLFATSPAIRKSWIDKIKSQQEELSKKKPIFETVPVFNGHEFLEVNKINHFITFNAGQQYLLAADDGVYVGHHHYKHLDTRPHKVLSLEKVTQVQAIESNQTLLVLADKSLWEYPLDVVNGKPELQPQGRLIQTHVPFFYYGTCLQKTMVCIPKISTLSSIISAYEPIKRIYDTNATPHLQHNVNTGKRQSLVNKILSLRSSTSLGDSNLRKIKDCYVPCEAYAVELSATMMLITTSRGVIMIDMRTDQPQQLLNPADKNLSFIMEREKEPTTLNLRQSTKRIAIFRAPRNHYFICYDGN
ncbi:unnamed protein product [Rhizopus microsporus]